MKDQRPLAFFHAPNSRSSGVLALLEELGADYELHVLNLKKGEQRAQAYLAVNPMGKVPALLHGAALVTEQVAVYLYLADLYPDVGLAPRLDDPLRGPYLRWLAFYGSCFEPAVIDRSMKRDPAPAATSPYGDFETMLRTLTDQLEHGPYLFGDRFTAADVLWGSALAWTTAFGLVPSSPAIERYLQAVQSRPAMIRARARDAELAAAQV
ncbi:MAG TPA: glutathione S-transferase family protein [Steroidobacteraceae bacterium]|jgi:glutathione S-transferase|nr:glutathione S-transferase family protein [Steroidobacteraceae bacterium]